MSALENASAEPHAPFKSGPRRSVRRWVTIGGMMLGVYFTGLDTTMLSTITPSITDTFDTINDISWYEAAYLLAVSAFIPLVGRIYDLSAAKAAYISFIGIFEIGSVICALSTTSAMFIAGRAVNGVGSAGLLTGALLIINSMCDSGSRPLVTAIALSHLTLGAITGPIIAAVLAEKLNWRWCFWIFLPLGGLIVLTTWMAVIPPATEDQALRNGITKLHKTLDPIGFVIFGGATSTFILGITWGGHQYDWSSGIILGLLCGSLGLTIVFILWSSHSGNTALIPLKLFRRQSVAVGSVVMFLQAGTTQMIPFYLPLWFQAIRGDSTVESAVHMLPSLGSQIAGLVVFGLLVRRLQFAPPWAVLGSSLSAIGSGFLTTLSSATVAAQWNGYQVVTSFGRGIAFQVPIFLVQEDAGIDAKDSATVLALVNLFMTLGLATAVSGGQTIFRGTLPSLLRKYAPAVDVGSVLNAGATDILDIVQPDQLFGVLQAYNLAITRMFWLSTATSSLAIIVSLGLSWKRQENKSVMFRS